MDSPLIVAIEQPGRRPGWEPGEVGRKAVGLAGLPAAWCPPFLVVTTSAYRRWCSAGADGARRIFEEAGLRDRLNRVLGTRPPTAKLLVRSSAPEEGLSDRGRYESADCPNRDDEIAATIDRLWAAADGPAAGLALILQPSVEYAVKGHLSNERRLSKESRNWVCEYEGRGDRTRIRRFVAGDAFAPAGDPLGCVDRSALFRQLAAVAAVGSQAWGRVHYEWVWDGSRLWMVQQDVEEPRVGPAPGSANIRSAQQHSLNLDVLIPSERSTGPWHKVYCARVFRDCGLRTVPIYAIEGDAIRGLAAGHPDPRVGADVGRLGAYPIVVRTDVATGVKHPSTLLARTDSVDAAKALEFVADQSAALISAGLEPSQFCFLLHNYIAAKGASLSRAVPSSNLVTIDATWGNADGLMYYPHDSYDVTLGRRPAVRARVRCKDRFIDCRADGRWDEREAGIPWDWQPALSKVDAVSIARDTKAVADRVGHPVEVMHFVGVDTGGLSPACLPWYFNSESKDETDPAARLQRVSIFSKDVITIRSVDDVRREAERAAGRVPPRGCTLRLVPGPGLLRDQSFLAEVASFAVQHELPVRLVGSALSHVFYVLRRHGVKLKVPLPVRRGPRPRKFNKLVRDNIPRIIRGHGEAARVSRVRLADHPDLIKAKLLEEAFELFWEQAPKGVRRELADVLEVLRAICAVVGIEFEDVQADAARRREERGGFDSGTILLETGPPLQLPKAVQPTLFDASTEGDSPPDEPDGDLTARRPEPDLPRATRSGLSIPLVPPESGLPPRAYPVRTPDGRLDVLVTYTVRNILIRLAPVRRGGEERPGGGKPATGQGSLFDEAGA